MHKSLIIPLKDNFDANTKDLFQFGESMESTFSKKPVNYINFLSKSAIVLVLPVAAKPRENIVHLQI